VAPPAPPLPVREFAGLVKAKYPDLADTNDDVLVANVLAKWPVYRAWVDSRSISEATRRVDDEIALEKRVAAIARTIATKSLVHERRVEKIPTVLAVCVLPAVVLYGLGWSFGWVRRGFNGEELRQVT